MCIKKVACGLQKVVKEDGREVLEPIFVEVDCPEDMHRITSKIDSCKTVTPKIEHHGTHGGHGGATVIDSPTGKVSTDTKVTTDTKEVTTDTKEVTTDTKEVTTGNKGVVCVETGEIFSSIRQASKSINVDFSNIAKCCKGKLRTAGGYHWKYL